MSVADEIASLATAYLRSGAQESRRLEFKAATYEQTEGGRKEFAKDVSAFANSDGGMIIIGVAEEPSSINVVGVAGGEIDSTIQWLEAVANSWISPQIILLRVVPVEFDGLWVIAIDIPQGIDQPYEVPKAGARFFVREERSIRPMSRDEVRAAILRSEDLSQRIERFFLARWQRMRGDKLQSPTLGPSQQGCLLIATPISSHTYAARYAVPELIKQFPHRGQMYGGDISSAKPNIDGVDFRFRDFSEGVGSGWRKIYRHGAMELVDGYLFEATKDSPVPGLELMRSLLASLAGLLSDCHSLTGASRVRIDFGIRTANGRRCAFYNDQFYHGAAQAVDRDELVFTPLVVEMPATADDLPLALRPLLDEIWQAFGYVDCGYFEGDSWKPRA